MKSGLTKLCILILILALVLCGCGKKASNSTTESRDGIVAVLSTDRTTYTGLDTAKAGLEIINNTGKRVAVSTQVNAPEGLKLNMNAVEGDLLLEPGQQISLSEITVKMNPTGIIIGIVLGILALAGAAFVVLFVIRKKKVKQITSMLLCVVMLIGLIAPVISVSAIEDDSIYYSGDLTVSHPVSVDGKEVRIEAVVNYQIGIAEEEPATEPDYSTDEEEEWIDPDTDKPNAKVTAFFYNDYDGEKASYDAGATVNQQDQLFSLAADGDNGYMRVEIANELTTATYQADFKNNKLTDHFVAHFKLSTEKQVPNGFYMLYRYCTESNTALFDFTEDGSLHIKKETYSQYKLVPGQWLEMDLVFDLSPVDYDQCTFYVGGKKLTTITLPEHEEHYKIPYVRFHIPGTGNKGKTALIDDFIVYEGKEILSIDEVNSPGYPYWPKPHATDDVAMELPDLKNLGDKVIAVAVGSDQAYVNGELITLAAATQDGSSGDVFTDAYVPGNFLSRYFGASDVNGDDMYSILRYATGKNVLVDRRGMIVITEEKSLDAEDDVKLLTLLYGYLTTGELVNNYAVATVFSQNIIDRAVNEFDAEWAQTEGHTYPATQAATALYYMVLAAHMDPDVSATDGTVVAQEAVARIKKLVSGGREPWASPGCYWGHAVISSALLLAKNTPVIWEQMTEDDIKRIDLLMECLAIAANWGYNAENDYKTGFDLTGNFGKTYNPNFKNAYHTCYLSAAMYFDADGNKDGNELDEILTSFQYDSYIARLTEVGFENILYCWTIVDIFGVNIGEYMQSGGPVVLKSTRKDKKEQIAGAVAGDGVGVAVPFRYEDLQSKEVYDSSQLLEMFIDTVEFTYSWEVTSGDQAPGSMYYAHTLTYAESPWKGQMGMMREFSSGDAGARSKVEYCYLSAINIAPLYANLKLLGYWDYEDKSPELVQKMLEMDNRIYVGTEDMFFKMHEGYLGSANQTMVEEFEWKINQSLGAGYIKDIFMNFHFMKNEEIVMKSQEELKVLAERAEPKDGITQMPEGAIPARGRTLTQLYVTDFYTPIDPGKGYKNGGISFDVVLGDDLLDTEFNAVIALDKKYEGKTYNESPMLIQFKNGQIAFMDGDTYMVAGVKFGENYRFHIEMAFDCATGKYSGTLTQTWPETEKPVTASFTDYDFRTSAGEFTFVDSLMVVNQGDYNTLWVENVQVTGSDTVVPGEISKTVEIEIKNDWGNVPASKRLKEYKVNLTLFDMVSVKAVTFTAEDGWAAKKFVNLPAMLNGYDAQWGIATDATIDRYYYTIVQTGDYSYTVKWSSTKYFYDNNFESWNKGEYQAANTPIYDKNKNILQDWYDGSSKSKLTQGRDSTGNRYMEIGGSKASQFTVMLDKETKAQVYAFKMRLKLKDANSQVTGTHFAYRYSSDYTKHQFININNNNLSVGGHSLGALSPDQWTEFEVVLDFRTLTGEVFCGESTYRKTFELHPISSDQIVMYASPKISGLCLDDLQIYTMSSLSVSKPKDEANKNAELIVPNTIPKLDPAYKWYYSADFEYWNKGNYKAGNTPIKDAYGNVMIDQWSGSMGPLVRSEDSGGNHYLELTSPKPIQAVLNVDEAYDDGVYIVKWRMKLKDAESVSTGTVFSYRYNGMTKHNFASITNGKTAICGAQLGKLTADQWMEVMVVLDFNTLTGTVCDWEGNKLGSTTLYPITSSLFNIYASAGTSGLCIDDLQIFSGNVTILEPEPVPTDPSCIYNNDFDGQTVVAGDKDYFIPDSHGHIYQNNSDLFKTVAEKDGNTVLEISNGDSNTTNFVSVSRAPKAMSVKFRVRLKDAQTSIPANGFAIRYRAGSSRTPFANIGNNAVNIGSSSTALTTQWTDVNIFVDFANGKLQYTVGTDTSGEMSIDPVSGVHQLDLGYCTGVFEGLYLDDLIIRMEESAAPEEPTQPSEPSEPTEPSEPSQPSEPTAPTEPENSEYTWYYNNGFNGQTVNAGDKDYYIKDSKNRVYQNNSDLFKTVVLPDGNTVLEVANNGSNATNFIALADQPELLTVQFKARLKDASVTIPANGFAIRYRNASSRISFATFGNNGFQVGGSNTALSTEWTDVKIVVDFANGKLRYQVGAEAVGEVSFDPITGVNQLDFGYCTGTFAGLYLDDVQIYTGVYETEEAPTEPPADGDTIEMTVAVGWKDGNDADGLRPSSVYVSIYNGTTLVKREAVTKHNDWKHTFSDLPKYDDQNNVITYTVVVESADVPEEYEAAVNGNEVALNHTPVGNIKWYYKNDFDGQTIIAGDKDYYMKDEGNRVFQNNNDLFRTVTLEDGNTVLSLAASGSDTSFVQITDSPSSVTVKFRVRLAEETTSFTGRVLELRYRDGKKPFAAFVDGNLDMSTSTNNNAYAHRTPLSTQWIDVEMTLDAANGKIYYTVDGVTGEMTVSLGALTQLDFYSYTAYEGIDIDDLKIYTKNN